MKKTDKKIENAIRKSLTEVCEIALKETDGFEWITHLVNYSNYPKSLSITCVFDTKVSLSNLLSSGKDEHFYQLIKDKLGTASIPIHDIRQQVNFDTEEACQNEHGGKWDKRLK